MIISKASQSVQHIDNRREETSESLQIEKSAQQDNIKQFDYYFFIKQN